MKILLTGSSGMVGRNLLDHSSAQLYEWLTPGSHELNLLDYKTVRDYIAKYQPEFIIHAAGRVGGIQANIKEPVRFLTDNLDMGRNVLMAAAEIGVPHLINYGSTCMYPKDQLDALSEEDILNGRLEPTNEGYALAKIAVARLATYISRENSDLKYKTIIPCNLYGLYDKFDPQRSHMIPAVIHKLHLAKEQGANSVEIWGTGNARREFMYTGDLANATFKAIAEFNSVPDVLNIGLGHDYTVNEYYAIAAKVIDYQGDFYHNISKPEGMQRKLSNVTKAKQWGWYPSYTLEQGLAKTYQHYLEIQGI